MSTFIQLQSKLLNQLKEYAKLPDDSENTKNLSNDIVGKIFDIESLIEYQVAFVSKKYSGLKLKIKHSEDCHVCDELEINTSKMNIFDNESQQQLMAELEEILEMIGWIYEFKKQWKQIVNDNEYRRQELKKKTRRETIETEVDKVTTSSSDEREVHSYAFPKTKTETSKAQLLKTTKKLTNSLMRGNQILETGILQSDLNLDELRSQTHSITIMNEKYQQFETIFKKTNQLVKSLERASQQEKRDVYLSLAFLIMCISWVLWRRIFKLPVKLALWMLFQFFKGILLTMGLVQKNSSNMHVKNNIPTIPTAMHDTIASAHNILISTVHDTLAETMHASIIETSSDSISSTIDSSIEIVTTASFAGAVSAVLDRLVDEL